MTSHEMFPPSGIPERSGETCLTAPASSDGQTEIVTLDNIPEEKGLVRVEWFSATEMLTPEVGKMVFITEEELTSKFSVCKKKNTGGPRYSRFRLFADQKTGENRK